MNNNNKKPVKNPHDQFFRKAMSDLRVARDFLQTHLPKPLSQVVNFDKLERQPRSYLSGLDKEYIVDVLFKTEIAGKDGYLFFLVEHQSKPDKLMSFRVLQYTIQIMAAHLKKHKSDKKPLPLVYPMVLYHGRAPYRHSNDIKDLINAPNALIEQYFLKPFELIDLSHHQR